MTTPRTSARGALTAMYGGAVLTVGATLAAFLDRAGLADHVRAGYPEFGQSQVDEAVTVYTVVLSIVGGLGLIGWLGTIWAARTGRRWAPWLAGVLFVGAVCFALAALTVRDTSGDVGLAPRLAWLQVLPCLAGLVAVVLLWRRPR
ncbi:hypothetical protein DZF91_10825 [Actinomadura logoneensis]|uniref:Uncharacterized protein n=1 Tax=Actinomadura logoneensis TaxID=2293572 RepID=A0A372JQN5_9ACTN|nr:hypothetical protein [Actinomadura logoneensis]RFU41658.1 hypothetical protein DZF91_10825 [Actinomadura logoneensis]